MYSMYGRNRRRGPAPVRVEHLCIETFFCRFFSNPIGNSLLDYTHVQYTCTAGSVRSNPPYAARTVESSRRLMCTHVRTRGTRDRGPARRIGMGCVGRKVDVGVTPRFGGFEDKADLD